MRKAIYFISMLLLIVGFFLASIFIQSLNEDFYRQQYEQNNTPQYTGMSVDDLVRASNTLLDYMMGYLDDMEVTALVNGEERLVFDERETMHMVDVKVLFQNALYTMYGCFALAAVGINFAIITNKKQTFEVLCKAFNKTLIIFVVVVAFFGAMFYFNFNYFWTMFHEILFTNDLWLLDPNVSIMINMFPLNFFLSLCVNILIMFIVCVLVTFIVLNVPRIIMKHKELHQ